MNLVSICFRIHRISDLKRMFGEKKFSADESSKLKPILRLRTNRTIRKLSKNCKIVGPSGDITIEGMIMRLEIYSRHDWSIFLAGYSSNSLGNREHVNTASIDTSDRCPGSRTCDHFQILS